MLDTMMMMLRECRTSKILTLYQFRIFIIERQTCDLVKKHLLVAKTRTSLHY